MTTIEELNRLTLTQQRCENELTGALTELRDELDTVQRKHLAKIKRLAANFAASESELRAAVNNGRSLFRDRKTMILNGIKVGLRAAAGKLVCEDEEATVKLIRKHFPDLAEALIAVEEFPKIAVVKGTLAEADWKKIGCALEGVGDHVVVSSVDSEVEKTIATMVKKLVNSMVDTEELKEAA